MLQETHSLYMTINFLYKDRCVLLYKIMYFPDTNLPCTGTNVCPCERDKSSCIQEGVSGQLLKKGLV